MKEKQIIKKLLETSHINVPERKALPKGKARMSVIKSCLSEHFEHNDRFPLTFNKEMDFSGCIIFREKSTYRVYCKAEVSMLTYQVVVDLENLSLDEVIIKYLTEVYKGDNIDGVTIEWDDC